MEQDVTESYQWKQAIATLLPQLSQLQLPGQLCCALLLCLCQYMTAVIMHTINNPAV